MRGYTYSLTGCAQCALEVSPVFPLYALVRVLRIQWSTGVLVVLQVFNRCSNRVLLPGVDEVMSRYLLVIDTPKGQTTAGV